MLALRRAPQDKGPRRVGVYPLAEFFLTLQKFSCTVRCRLLTRKPMMKIKAYLFVFLIGVLPAQAQVSPDQIRVVQNYLSCFEGIVDGTPDAERLACYDALAGDIAEWIGGGSVPGDDPCRLDGVSHSYRSGMVTITGSATCANATIRYRIFDGEEFITAGTGYIRGSALSTITAIPRDPQNFTMRYSIEPD